MALVKAPNVTSGSDEEERPVYRAEAGDHPWPISLQGPDRFIVDGQGWIHLRKNRRESLPPWKETMEPARTAENITTKDVDRALSERRGQWVASNARTDCDAALRSMMFRNRDLRVDQCLCIGIGTFSGMNPYEPLNRPLGQIAALFTFITRLRKYSHRMSLTEYWFFFVFFLSYLRWIG